MCAALAVLVLIVAGNAAAATINEAMTNATAPGWVMGGSAYLTASTGADPAGSGWLRLTEPNTNQAGFAMLDSSFDISQGVVIQFDYATWGGNGADGYSIFLFDGSYDAATFAAGASGGSLGYDKKTAAPVHAGLTGGYIGVGIDEYGNFSSPTEGRSGGPGLRANSVAVRGPFNHPTAPYQYLGGTAANVGTLWFNQSYRPLQNGSGYRKVVVYLTPVAAPNYMRVDVYLQYGYNQPLTQVLNGLYTGVQIPTTVKVGYAASTGGSTNYHEIRNLTVDPLPTDINLGIAATVSSPAVAPGDQLTYTVTVRNYGPAATAASDVPISDNMPLQLTGVTWACSGSSGGVCGTDSGSGSLDTTATLPFNGAVTYTITGTVDPATPLGSVISNSASLSAPAGIIDYSPADNSATVATTVSSGTIVITGTVFNDSGAGGGVAHNGVSDGSETGVNAGLTYYAKIFRSGDLNTTVATPVQVSATTGAYSFSGIPAYGSYIIILSTTATANLYDPGFPSANWIAVSPANLALGNIAANGSDLPNRDFFLYNGSRITGKVIRDDGFNGSVSNAYDGILNGAETGIAGVAVTLRDDADTTTHDFTVTDSGGNFTLYTDTASATLRIYETNPAGHISVSYSPGTTAGSYTVGGEYIRFAYTLYTDYSGVLFGDITQPVFSFSSGAQGAGGTPAAPVYHAHVFSSPVAGSVAFSAVSRTQTGWPDAAYLLDSNCNGSFDAGEPDIAAAINVKPNQAVCILARVVIPNGAAFGSSDQLVTRASFTAGQSLPQTSDVTDTTAVLMYPNLASSSVSWTDLNGGSPEPGDVLRYTVTIRETNGMAVSGVSVSGSIDPVNLVWNGVSICPDGAVCSYNAGTLNVADVNLPAYGTATIVYDVAIGAAVGPGTVISTIAVVSLPGYPAIQVAAPAVSIPGSVPGSGNTPLYLYGTPSLSRTVNNSTTSIAVGTSTTVNFPMNPVAAGPITISPTVGSSIPVQLIVRRANNNGTRSVTVTLQCGSTGTIFSATQNCTVSNSYNLCSFALPLTADETCPDGSAWNLGVRNNSTADGIRVYPYNAGLAATSRVTLPATTVINVDSIGPYDAAYAGGSQLSSAVPGSTVYIRTVVSDPFGSYDIFPAGGTAPALTIRDPYGNILVNSAAMTLAATGGETPSLTKTFEYPYTIPDSPAGNWFLQVTAAQGTEGTVRNSRSTIMPVVPLVPDLTVTKSHIGNFSQGQNGAVYTITPANAGSIATNGPVIVIDTLPAGLSYVSGRGYGWTCWTYAAGQDVTCASDAVIGAGSTGSTITLTVNVAPNAPALLVNSASVSGYGEFNTANNTASDSTVITPVASVITTVTPPAVANAGSIVSVPVSFSNIGGIAADGVIYTLALSPGLEGVSCLGATCNYDIVTGIVTVTGLPTSLSSGQSENLTLLYTAPPSGTVTVNGSGTLITIGNATADVMTTVTAPAGAIGGEPVHAGISYLNLGPGSAADVTYSATLPPGLTGVSCSGSGALCSYDNVTGQVTVSGLPATLLPGQSVDVDLTYISPLSGNVVVSSDITTTTDQGANVASGTTSDGPTIVAVATSDVTTVVAPPASAYAGSTVSVPAVFSNIGPAIASGVTYGLTLSPGLIGVSCSGSGASCSYDSVTGIVTVTGLPATLENGQTERITVVFTAPASGSVTVGSSFATSTGDSNAGNNPANAVVLISSSPTLTLTIVGPGSVHGTSSLGQNYSCGGGTCPATPFAYNDTLTLTATGSYSTFSSWAGDYSGTSNPGSITMDRTMSVTVTFVPDPARVRIDGDPTPYYAIAVALSVPTSAAVVRAVASPEFVEYVIMDNPVPVHLKGGYTDADFTVQSGYTTVSGPIRLRAGRLVAERIKIKP